MPQAVQCRKVVSFLAQFGPVAVVWLIGIVLLYRSSQLDGAASEGAFLLGISLVICASRIGSARRSRQKTTRERALEIQVQALTKRVRTVENKVDDVIMDVDTDNAALALRKAVKSYSADHRRKPSMQLVSRNGTSEG